MKTGTTNNKLSKIIVLAILCFAMFSCLCVTTYALVIYNSTRGQIEGNTIEVTAEANFSLSSNNSSITFNKAKDSDSIKISLKNNSNVVLHYYYKLTFTDSNGNLSKAILVSHNGTFIKTLNNFTATDSTIEDEYAFVNAGETIEDNITFELHEAIKGTLLDSQSLNVTVDVYTESADYIGYMFVTTEEEYKAAIDDVNSGLLSDNPKIVLLSDISLESSYKLEKECTLVLNGHSVSGTTVLNSDDAFMDIVGITPSLVKNFTLTLTKYNKTKAEEALSKVLKENLKYGIDAKKSIANLSGTLLPYSSLISVVGENYTLNSDTLTAFAVTGTQVEQIKVGDSEVVDFVIYDGNTNIDKYLEYMPSSDDIVSEDLYLPTSISSLNATIEWTSSDLSLMDNQGKIVSATANLADMTYYAKIKVNNTIYTKAYSFKVSVYNDEINFNKMVSEISPVVIYTAYDETNKDEAYYYLPIVDSNSDYDYRKNYTSPKEGATYTWAGMQDILLTDLTYSLILDENGNELYDYIGLDGNAVYLKGDTLNTYAQIEVTGTFDTGDTYTSTVNINIAVGTRTEILEPAFKHVQDNLSDVDILYSLISTRIESGMAKEKGSFKLPSKYSDDINEFTITYSASSDVISSIEATNDGEYYEITVDPTKFSKTESTIPLTVTVSLRDDIVKGRTVYFTVPAVLKTSDIGNASLFNSIKYQVFENLPENEKGGDTGFTKATSTIKNTTPDYILIRDIVGDSEYKTKYIAKYDEDSGYLSANKLNYSESDYVKPIESLKFYITDKASSASSTDSKAYDFARLIEWAIGSNKTKISDLGLTNTSYINSYTSTESDGKEYLTTNELTVLKAYYNGATNTTKWDTVYALVSEKAPGYVFSDTTALNEAISNALNNYVTENSDELYFKYVEILQVILEKKDHTETGYYFPNMGTIGANSTYGWGSSGAGIDDGTTYISEKELWATKVFWQNALKDKRYVSSTTNASTYQTLIVNALDAAVTWPEYFVTGGIGKIINYFYEDAGIKVGETNGYTAPTKSNVPTVTNMDSLNAIFNYFPKLTTLEVVGNSSLSAFLEDYSLSTFFNRLTAQTPDLTTLTLKYCASNYVEMDISNIKEFDKLTQIDLSNNTGLTNTSYLVNVNSGNYTKVNFQNIGVTYEFQEYAITSLSSATCTVSYTNDSGEQVSTTRVYTTDKALTYLHEFDELIAENMFLVDKVYEEASNSTDIYWRIDSGNKITSVSDAGKYSEIDSINAMNMAITPYYYCTKTFTFDNVTFEKGKIYKITSSGTSIAIGVLNIDAEVVDDVSDSTINTKITEDEIKNGWSKTDKAETAKYTDTSTDTTETTTITSEDNVIFKTSLQETSKNITLTFNCFYFYRNSNYITASGTIVTLNNNSSDEAKMCFLTEDEAKKLINNSYTSNTTLGQTSIPYSTTVNDSSLEAYYIYFPSVNKILTLSGTSLTNSLSDMPTNSDDLSSIYKCKVYYNSGKKRYYYIYSTEYTSTGANQVYFVQRNNNSIAYSNGVDNNGFDVTSITYEKSYTVTALIYNSSFILYDQDGEIDRWNNVYEFGYDIVSIENKYNYQRQYFSSEVSFAKDKYFYCDGKVYKTSYNYNNSDTKTLTYYYTKSYSAYHFYYRETENGDKIYIDSYDVVLYDYSYTDENGDSVEKLDVDVPTFKTITSQNRYFDNGTEIENFDSDTWYNTWNENFIANAYDATKLSFATNTYISHIIEVDSEDTIETRKSLMQQVKAGYYDSAYYLYTGTSGSENVYKESTSAESPYYYNGYGYTLYVDSSTSTLAWKRYGSLSQNTATTTLDSILQEANSHFSDNRFGMYYGMYYAYTGESVRTSTGSLYEQYHMYRIMLNETNTAFIFEDAGAYAVKTTAKATLLEIVNGTIGATDVGKIYYLQTVGDTYTAGFYKLTYDADSNAYNLMKFADVDYDYSSVKLLNRRIYSANNNYLDQNDSGKNYGGTGGSFDVVITAFIRETDGSIVSRKFKVTVTG